MQPLPPRRPLMRTVVIRGVDPDITDSEVVIELQLEERTITNCLRIKN